MEYFNYWHCVKSVRIRSFSGPCFPVFSPNTGKYGLEKLRIQTLFTQCEISGISLLRLKVAEQNKEKTLQLREF